MSPTPSDLPPNREAPRFFGRSKVFLPTGSESAAFDRWAMEEAGVPSPVLMENAGRGAALVLDRVYPEGPVVVLVGGGNNGGDGLVLARTLASNARMVRVIVVGDRSLDDRLLHGWPLDLQVLPESPDALVSSLRWGRVIVDALLGTGVRGEPREPFARVIRAVNETDAPVMALDLPSGVDADRGTVPGEAVRAALTVAFGAPKLGTLLFPARERAGRIVAIEIGFPPMAGAGILQRLITPGWAHAHRPHRSSVTHKKAEGRLLLVAGSSGIAGAAVLATRGALRAGAGYVRIASHPENRDILQRTVPEAIFVDVTDAVALQEAAGDSDALAAGPGMGVDDGAAARLERLLADGRFSGVLLDADAVTLLGAGRLPAFVRAATAERRLLTPHPGEMARLGVSPEEIRQDPVEVCRRESGRLDATLLLKGQPSLVSRADEEIVWVSGSGSSDLARAGIGDVLTGAAGAFLARGVDAQEAAGLGLHFTGRAASLTRMGEALLPSDVADRVGDAFQEPALGSTDLNLPFVTLDLDPTH
jgi:ADP-dependent NAD(P)H-hydrate dehydratase / NAD(P)H-hydrate epimerase